MKISPFSFLFISIIGLLSLTALLPLQNSLVISTHSDLDSLKHNQKISVSGKVIKESYYFESKILTLDNKIQLHCSSCSQIQLKDKTITAEAKFQNYNNQKTLDILKLKIK